MVGMHWGDLIIGIEMIVSIVVIVLIVRAITFYSRRSH